MSVNNPIRFFLMAVLAIVTWSFSTGTGDEPAHSYRSYDTLPDTIKVDTILKRAYSVMGTPYKWAGATPQTGFDCSGYVYWCYKPVGVSIPRSGKGLYNLGKKIEMEEARAGDIILFKGTDARTKGVGHVGIVVSKKGEPLKFVHSSSSKQHWGVIETVYGGSYYVKRFIGIRRVFDFN